MVIHERVEKIRKEKGVTKTHIAKACGKTSSWYTDISKGNIRLTVDDLEKIAKALSVKITIFFT